MLAEFSICPVGCTIMSEEVAKVMKVLKKTGIKYQLGPLGTCLEGTLPQILSAIRRCHQAVAKEHDRVITQIKLYEHKKKGHSLEGMVSAVESKLQRRAFGKGIEQEC
jgi:uncharacterized protein (TIGR00106 family)